MRQPYEVLLPATQLRLVTKYLVRTLQIWLSPVRRLPAHVPMELAANDAASSRKVCRPQSPLACIPQSSCSKSNRIPLQRTHEPVL